MTVLKETGKTVTEFSGIMPNPTYKKVQDGAALAIGLPTTLSEMGISDTDFQSIAKSTILTGGCCKKLTADEIEEILKECI